MQLSFCVIILNAKITWVSLHTFILKIFLFLFYICVCVCVYFTCMYVCTVCMPGTHRAQKREFPGTQVTDSCELPYECWGSLQGLLSAEPSFQPIFIFLYVILVLNNLMVFTRHLSVLSAYTVTSMLLAKYKILKVRIFTLSYLNLRG